MELKNLLTENRAVSPVIGVILMVAITVILAAVIATFVLGLGEEVQQTSPDVSVSFDLTTDVELDAEDDFGNAIDNGLDNPDGEAAILTLRHSGGQSADAGELSVGGSSAYGSPQGFAADDSHFDGGSSVSAGDTIEIWVGTGDRIDVIWEGDGGDSAILADYRGPDA